MSAQDTPTHYHSTNMVSKNKEIWIERRDFKSTENGIKKPEERRISREKLKAVLYFTKVRWLLIVAKFNMVSIRGDLQGRRHHVHVHHGDIATITRTKSDLGWMRRRKGVILSHIRHIRRVVHIRVHRITIEITNATIHIDIAVNHGRHHRGIHSTWR